MRSSACVSSLVRALSLTVLCTAGFVASTRAQVAIDTDDRDGVQADFEIGPVHPLEQSADGRLWCLNSHDASVSVLEAATLALIDRVYVGLGPSSIRRRPNSDEMWVVCCVSNQVLVIDAPTRRVMNGIRVEFEPRDCAFDASGRRACVSAGATNQIHVINARTKRVTAVHEFGDDPDGAGFQPFLHREEPRALLMDGDLLYGLSFESGNGTIPIPFVTGTVLIADLWANSTFLMPQDVDVVQFDLANPSPAGVATLQRVGAMNFDLAKIPASNALIVSNMQLNNAFPNVGEFRFATGGIADHRVTIAEPGADPLCPTEMKHIDLNLGAAFTGLPATFSMPTQIAVDASGHYAYVACYESRNTAVIDLLSQQVHAVLNAGALAPNQGFGPRGLVLDQAAGRLYVFNRADLTLDEFQVPVALGSVNDPLRTVSTGFDVSSSDVKAGRLAFIDALNSFDGAQSCNTCHVDGHTDRLAWDLSDFTGNKSNPSEPPERKDVKGVRVTQSLFGIEETEPLHWRGDRRGLHEFQGAVPGLLGGVADGAAFDQLIRYVHSLSYRPNPLQNADRTITTVAEDGFDLYQTKKFSFLDDSLGNKRQVTCIECHALNAGSGTNNQVTNESNTSIFSENPAQLRGLGTKHSDAWLNTVNWSFTGITDAEELAALNSFPVTGFGFRSTGLIDNLVEFIDRIFPVTLQEAAITAQFCQELDTGSAPAIGFATTLAPGSPDEPFASPVHHYLIPEAHEGNIDLVARGWMFRGALSKKWITLKLLFDPATDRFDADTPGFGPYTFTQLCSLIGQRKAAFTFFGAPRGAGIRLGQDGDLDGIRDGAEAARGASSFATDTDGDSFPDGHEIRNGSNPADFNSTPVDTLAPMLRNVEISWTNSTTAKLHWNSNEIATSRVHVTNVGGETFDAVFEEPTFKTWHVLVVRGLHPGRSYQFSVEGDDPAHNAATPVLQSATMQAIVFPYSMFSNTVELTKGNVNPNGTYPVTIQVEVRRHDGGKVQDATVTLRVVEWVESASLITNQLAEYTGSTDANGIVQFAHTTQYTQGSGATLDTFVSKLTHAVNLHFFPISGASGFHAQMTIQ